jgi:membrane dipeptidase
MANSPGPRIDVHAHPGRCFLAGLDPDHPLMVVLDGEHAADALAAAHRAGMTAVSLATVADLLVLGPDADGGLGAIRDFAPGEAAADHARQLDGVLALVERAGAPLARTAADIERARSDGRTAVLLTCEGGDFLAGDLDGLAPVHARGVTSLTLVHYRVNEIGDIQTAAPVHGGLTGFGRRVVAEANRLGLVVDCAHATYEVTRDVVDASTDPVMISHSHLDHTDRHHPRLLSDAHATAVATAGGLIGAWPSGVTSATLEDFVDEIVRLVDLVGVDHVAVGTDMDANFRPVLSRYDEFASLDGHLARRGFTSDDTDRVLGGNALELLRRVAG